MRRRDFLYRTSALVAAAAAPNRLLAANSGDSTRIPLGLDAHSMRGMKWKATQLIEFAAEQRLDAVLLNSLNYFESLEESHLLKLKQLADGHNLRIYMGAGGICENGAKFSDKWGNAESMLATGIRVATTIGSPVVNVRIGSIDDRFLKGGIQPRIDEAVRVLKAAGKRAEDAQKTRRRRGREVWVRESRGRSSLRGIAGTDQRSRHGCVRRHAGSG